jgi:6,7-dimethyl-8-ribityllumazine synthase
MKIAIVMSRFNEDVTHGLRDGAFAYLSEKGIQHTDISLFEAPGAFEVPLIAKTLAQTSRYAGVICLGCVIKGDTAHFEFISLGATLGIQQASLATNIPITFGILTTYTEEQAQVRSRADAHNKGREAAAACLDSIHILQMVRQS